MPGRADARVPPARPVRHRRTRRDGAVRRAPARGPARGARRRRPAHGDARRAARGRGARRRPVRHAGPATPSRSTAPARSACSPRSSRGTPVRPTWSSPSRARGVARSPPGSGFTVVAPGSTMAEDRWRRSPAARARTPRSTPPLIPTVAAELAAATRVRGRIVIVGVYKQPTPIDLQAICFKEQSVVGVRVYTSADVTRAIELIADGRCSSASPPGRSRSTTSPPRSTRRRPARTASRSWSPPCRKGRP